MGEKAKKQKIISTIQGEGNQLPDNEFLGKILVNIWGNENKILIHPSVVVDEEIRIFIEGNKNIVSIGENTTVVQMAISMAEDGHRVSIGRDCMISSRVEFLTSDFHSILDRETGVRLNPGANILVEDHVWIGRNVQILKGAIIRTGSVVATGALVSAEIPRNVVSCGKTVLRTDVFWKRDLKSIPFAVPISYGLKIISEDTPNMLCNIELVKELKISGRNWTYCRGWALCSTEEEILFFYSATKQIFRASQHFRQDIVETFALENKSNMGFEILLPINLKKVSPIFILVGKKKYRQREITNFFTTNLDIPMV